jgi:hypothetical protein
MKMMTRMKLKFVATFGASAIIAVAFSMAVQGADSLQHNAKLQADLMQFPLLTLVTNSDGQPIFQTLALKNPVVIDGKKYFGFRFQVPRRKKQEDFAWAFVQPVAISSWYILPKREQWTAFKIIVTVQKMFIRLRMLCCH